MKKDLKRYHERFPKGYWKNEDNMRKELKRLFEEKLHIEKNMITVDDIRKNKLGGLLSSYFNNSTYEAIDYMYPGKYKPWEKCNVSRGYWSSEDNIKEALLWLFEEKIDIKNNIVNVHDFRKYGLGGLFYKYFNGSTYEAIHYVYKDKYKPWEKSKVTRKYWDDEEHVKDALKWLFEDIIDIKSNIITVYDFKKNGLYGLLNTNFNQSTYEAINYMYPNKYKAWERCSVPKGYWNNEDHIKDAILWLFEEKVKSNDITVKDFKEYRLNGLLANVFNYSTKSTIEYYNNIK